MNTVYIFNNNSDTTFNSLLMTELSNRNIRFNNMKTTRSVHYGNILIYIPKVGIGELVHSDITELVNQDREELFRFKYKVIPSINPDDYRVLRSFFDTYVGRNGFRYYQSDSFSTFYATVIANDCNRLIRRFQKFYNK